MSANPSARPQSRRSFLAAGTAAVAIAAPVAALAHSGADAQLIALGRDFLRLRAERDALSASYQTAYDASAAAHAAWEAANPKVYGQGSQEWGRKWCEAMGEAQRSAGVTGHPMSAVDSKLDALATKIEKLPATTLQGLTVKALLVFEYADLDRGTLYGQAFQDLDYDKTVVANLIRNLLAMAGLDSEHQPISGEA